MKSILNAIKSTLQSDSTLSYVADAAIVIETDNNYVPVHAAYPMITLKDGAINRERIFTGQSSGFDVDYSVNVNLSQRLLDDDKSIVGSGSTKGVLDLQTDVNSILHLNTLGIDGMIAAVS